MRYQQKVDFVTSFHARLNEAQAVVLVHQNGLTVAQSQQLRAETRNANGQYQVVKNRLGKLALVGTAFEPLSPYLSGPIAFVLGNEPVGINKVLRDFSGQNPQLQVQCGSYAGQVLAVEDLKRIADLPSLESLRAKLIGLIQAPAAQLTRLSREPGARLARLLASRNS